MASQAGHHTPPATLSACLSSSSFMWYTSSSWRAIWRRKPIVSYSQIRKSFGKPICEHQAIQLKLADMATQVEAARLLTERAAAAYDKGERCDMEAGMAKLAASEAAVNVSLEAMRIHGGYGYSKEFTVERLYRDAPLLVIGEGTNELQRIIIARQLIARNRV